MNHRYYRKQFQIDESRIVIYVLSKVTESCQSNIAQQNREEREGPTQKREKQKLQSLLFFFPLFLFLKSSSSKFFLKQIHYNIKIHPI